ncbi:MAG: pyridoxamine 5'-phosphate oxidase family protein [Bacteroidota bacterium]
MRRNEKEIEDKDIINEILSKSHICRIGLFDNEYPYVVPMNYGYNENSLYFHCSSKGKKLDLIRKNNKACFEIEQSHEVIKNEVSCKWTTKYRSVIGFGNIDIVTDHNEKIEALDFIMSQHGKEDNHYKDELIDKIVTLKLNISNLTAKQSGKW